MGVTLETAEAGELDQEQHDAVRDVFCVPTACLLVRIDLFRALGGFAPDIDFYGDDLDLCWRAHLSGARVLVVPDARARHRERLPERRPDLDVLALSERHRLRTALSAPTGFHLVGLSVFHVLYTISGTVVGLLTGRARQVRAMLGAWLWQLIRLPALFTRRRRFHSVRRVSDAEVASLQGVRGSARLRDLRRQRMADREGRGDRLAELGGDLRQQLGGEDARVNVVVWLVALLVILIGSRELLLSGVPHAGELLAWPAGPFVLVREYLGGWWSQGLGGTRPVPTGMGLSAVLGLITFGANGLPRTLLVVGPLFAGALGLWRLTRAIAPSRAAAAALVVYVAVPLAANAVGTGSLSGLLVYGALPWTLHGLARVHAAPPFVRPADPARARRLVCADVVVLGVLAAVVGSFVPVYPALMVGAALAFAIASLIVGERAGSGRMLLGSIVAALIALVLNLPWALGVLPSDAPRWTVARRARPPGGRSRVRRPCLLRRRAQPVHRAGPRPHAPARGRPPRRPLLPVRLGGTGDPAGRGRPGHRVARRPGHAARQPDDDPGVPRPLRGRPVHRCGLLRGRLRPGRPGDDVQLAPAPRRGRRSSGRSSGWCPCCPPW